MIDQDIGSGILLDATRRQNPARSRTRGSGDHVQLAYPVVGRETPVEALLSLFRVLPAVLVSSGKNVVGIITKIDLLAAGT
ncbi:MAG: hypothetical protein OK438_01155 [Thaumarchaeota archaeon]|nr:hypothetical protein [Nitrososphaerota archaeon]